MPPLSEQLEGRRYWRSVQELAQSPGIRAALDDEFGPYDPEQIAGMSRRAFMKIMGASMALAGLTLSGCRRWPQEHVRPHAYRPEGVTPGLPLHYATMMSLGGVASGVLARSYDGRPIKIEGNDRHPVSRGRTDAFAQASILSLYDPDRLRGVMRREAQTLTASTWTVFERSTAQRFADLRARGGAGLALLTTADDGPTALRLRRQFMAAFPAAHVAAWEPITREQTAAATKAAFGSMLRPIYDFSHADGIACFADDPLGVHPGQLMHARDWAAGRRSADEGRMNRLYAVESRLSLTGAAADHRLPLRPLMVGPALIYVAERLGVQAAPADSVSALTADQKALLDAMAADLRAAGGQALVTVGFDQSASLQTLGWAINQSLGSVGGPLRFIDEPAGDDAPNSAALADLLAASHAGDVTTLVILGGNPAYDAPADLDVTAALDRVRRDGQVIHLTLEANETSRHADWVLPEAHYLEAWGDGRAWDGTITVQQPLILPLFEGRTTNELLALLTEGRASPGEELVRQTFAGLLGEGGFEKAWRQTLEDGLIADSALPAVEVGVVRPSGAASLAPQTDYELLFTADYSVYDGRLANNGWLQEMPDPLTKLTWDNAALLSQSDAEALGVGNGDMLTISVHDAVGRTRTLEIVALIQPGVARGTIVLPLGYGRQAVGHVGRNVGFNTYILRTRAALTTVAAARVAATGAAYPLAMTQEHHLIDEVGAWGRDKRIGATGASGYIIHEATFDQYRRDPQIFRRDEHGHAHLQLFESPSAFNDPHAWGMAIDMNSCIGCNACVIACQAENNVPIVGKTQVAKSREMHWLRIDRYFKAEVNAQSRAKKLDAPSLERVDVVYQPMMCVHCENAPCEQVCPVAATVHDAEGLNTMVYNRCIGTRYCSNNCPYKVRRFNYFDYHSQNPRGKPLPWLGIPDQQQAQQVDELRQMGFNPEVTVRMRGVMEKCTYCVQRISAAKIHAKVEHANGRRDSALVRDGEVISACQGACPTEAIVFGDLNDPRSQVSRILAGQRGYAVLDELNTRPRSRHLAKLRNRTAVGSDAADAATHDHAQPAHA